MAGAALVMPPYDQPAPDQPEAAIRELAQVRDRLLGAGLAPERILLDPGFGFGLAYAGDLALWGALERLPRILDWPVERFCLGVSRKRFIARRAGRDDLPADQRDPLTATAHREALALGYRVFRTHTVPEAPRG
jgi:dihydropteroate synthase